MDKRSPEAPSFLSPMTSIVWPTEAALLGEIFWYGAAMEHTPQCFSAQMQFGSSFAYDFGFTNSLSWSSWYYAEGSNDKTSFPKYAG